MTRHWTDNLLAGKRIIVTGAAHGLGRAIAIACVGAGGQVLFTARDRAALAEALEEINRRRSRRCSMSPISRGRAR